MRNARVTAFFLLTFILFFLLLFSCRPKKTFDVVETTKVTETPVIDENPRGAVNTVHINEMLALAMERQEDYAQALNYWTLASKYPFSEDYIEDIVYGNSTFVATGHYRIKLAYSDDGDKWTAVDNIFDSSRVNAIVYGDGRFVAAAHGEKIAYSDDGMNWTLSNGGISDCYTEGIAYGNGIFVVVGSKISSGDGIIAYSSDGETWTIAEDGGLGIKYFQCIAYGNGQFIALAGEGKAAYSSDGKTWTAIPEIPFEDRPIIKTITYGNGRFVAFANYVSRYDPLLVYSDNGIDWTIVTNNISERFHFNNIVYANGIFIGVNYTARMVYSFDGETWYPDGEGFIVSASEGDDIGLEGIAYGNGCFVIGGGNGTRGSSKIAWCKMPPLVIENSSETSAEKNSNSSE
jgi:hypothetical protein